MKIIRTITEEDFGRKATPEKWNSYFVRPSARAILLNSSDEIALMYVKDRNYYKLPGGGIDHGESIHAALARELQEEVGASSIKVIKEIGQIDEYRDLQERKSEHYCFIVRLAGPLGAPERTEKETLHGYETVWVKGIERAIELVKSGNPPEYGQDFEQLREITFLEYVKAHSVL